MADEYAKFRHLAGVCGWMAGTAGSSPKICGRGSKHTTDHHVAVNGEVCGTHANKARRWGATVNPIKESTA